MHRRHFIRRMLAAAVAPAFVPVDRLMRVKPIVVPESLGLLLFVHGKGFNAYDDIFDLDHIRYVGGGTMNPSVMAAGWKPEWTEPDVASLKTMFGGQQAGGWMGLANPSPRKVEHRPLFQTFPPRRMHARGRPRKASRPDDAG